MTYSPILYKQLEMLNQIKQEATESKKYGVAIKAIREQNKLLGLYKNQNNQIKFVQSKVIIT